MITPQDLLPEDADQALLVGRVHDPEVGGPCVVVVTGGRAIDISDVAPTVSDLFERDDLLDALAAATAAAAERRGWSMTDLAAATTDQDAARPRLLAPVDLQVVKAAGVTFVESMLERVIEERAKGDAARAAEIRAQLSEIIGGAISSVRPGSESAARVKELLIEEDLWSQYLEVGIGPDPEIFTKAPVLSAVGSGVEIGVHSRSTWNNPEPEVVLAVRSDGRAIGATLGNDVNLRDFEGRSALLLTEAKDNNASCALGPFIRLFNDSFTMDDIRQIEVQLTVTGVDDFVLDGRSSMRNISRDPEDLIHHAYGDHHQYPDGFMLFTGTLFAPTQDRFAEDAGFTHVLGDVVRIATPRLGALVNRVTHSEQAPRWEFGIRALMSNLSERGLLAPSAPVPAQL
ncbi:MULTISPECIES: fumarylacetoacetate hydrolase family protein [unclassified Nocardioides]|uniref:fumarylacetoacetate hydrolase family protein n=1 Tax=unclassified Nocardioides TaxID=2615069 RepID=UPI0000571073|nr:MULTISPECIES: fumarylacetoacetate hydrolase family protein [unclassified Nocardioides]ABL83686.1 putative fumarylacetoacetate hydrolase [Nocardioides sp. JS614]